MNKHLYFYLALIALGLIIASALLQYSSITAINLLIAGGVLFAITLISSFFSHSIATKTSSNTNTTKAPKSANVSKKPIASQEKTVTGTVKWFNKTKGFGFITQSNGEDVFVHQTSIVSKPNILREGQAVTMCVVNDSKGPQAENVKPA